MKDLVARPAARRLAAVMLAGLVVVALVAVAVVVFLNRSGDVTSAGPLEPMPGPDRGMGSINALAIDPGDGSVYAGARFGLFRITETGDATRVANRHQEMHALAVLEPGHLLASGHLDPREDSPSKLGLIESTDGGRTWERRGIVDGLPQAIVASTDSRLFVATDTGVYASDDKGRMFTLRYREQ